jgi:acetoacetyl-CoA synthetase
LIIFIVFFFVSSCFAGVNPTLSVHSGEIQSPHLAMAIECWSEDGKNLEGESGELVCVKPFPSMPVSFWNDPDGEKYHRAYFDKYPGGNFLIKLFFLN